MITALLLGGGVGLGLLLLARGLRPPRRSLRAALARLQPVTLPESDPATPPTSANPAGWGLATRLVGHPAARLLDGLDIRVPTPGADLRVTGRTRERLLAEKVTLALAGLLWPPATLAVATLQGVRLPAPLAGAGLALAVGGWVLPDLALKQAARQRRRDIRHTLGVVLDLTVIGLAGGAGVEGALTAATRQGTDWTSTQLRQALDAARLRREPPWSALGRLGEAWDVPALSELAASAALAGTEGARVRASLTAKAVSLRAHQHADTEAEAAAATERMALPTVALAFGLLLFIGFPAVAQILASAPAG